MLIKARFQNISRRPVLLDRKAIWNYLKIVSKDTTVEISDFQAAESEADLIKIAPGSIYEETREIELSELPGDYTIELEYVQSQRLKTSAFFPTGRVASQFQNSLFF